jgi:ribonuclease E
MAFLEEWTADNIHGDEPEGDATLAKKLADEFLAAAAAEGIPKSEIDDVIDDLPGFMASQIEEANEREEHDDDDVEDEVRNEIEEEDDEDDEDEEEDDEDHDKG